MKQPHQYKQRILFVVIGMTPQIITESLYALAVKQQPAFVPTQIKVITTSLGAERVILNLLYETPGWFHRFCQDYGFNDIQFTTQDIQILSRPDGSKLDDIREPADNELMADTITEKIRQLTRDDESAVHVSIAGGRKTMGFYAGYALSLFGREQDRLSHVLIEADYESLTDFYYTTPKTKVIHTTTNKPLDTAKAKISLAEIPFVSLRHGLPKTLLEGNASFIDTVAIAKKALDPVRLEIDLANQNLNCGGEIIKLKPSELAFYIWLAKRKSTEFSAVRWTDPGIAEQFLTIYQQIVGAHSALLTKTEKTLKDGMTKEFFEQRMTLLKKQLNTALGVPKAKLYLFNQSGKKGQTRYELAVKATNIIFINSRNNTTI